MKGLAQNGHSRRFFTLAIEAEWRKHAAGVVPAQPKARPEGQRPIGVPLAPRPNFPTVPQVEPAHSVCLPHYPSAGASSSRTERRASVDLSHEAAAVLEPANRISVETLTKAPPMMQNVCRQIAEGIASWVTPWTSA
jgi:hypothetical protein